MSRLPSHFIDLVQEALQKSFWKKKSLRKFLRRSGISEKTLAQWHADETKREWLEKLLPTMEESDRGQQILQQMGRELADQVSFPDLKGWEESGRMMADAKEAVAGLSSYFEAYDRKVADEKERKAVRDAAQRTRDAARQARGSLEALQQRLTELAQNKLGTQGGGYAFEAWFYDLMVFSEIEHRRPYRAQGRQIDGAVTIEGTTYLVEIKFASKPTGPKDVSDFDRKVEKKADNTMGLMLSMSDFTDQAVEEASGPRSLVLLMTSVHVFHILQGVMSFEEMVKRIRRHASQTGEPRLLPQDF